MKNKPGLGQTFLELPALSAYGVWILIFLFPLTLAGIMVLIDEKRSPESLILASYALGIISASYMLRFYLVRNTETLRTKVLKAANREQALYSIIGGFWWWAATLTCAITTVVYCNNVL